MLELGRAVVFPVAGWTNVTDMAGSGTPRIVMFSNFRLLGSLKPAWVTCIRSPPWEGQRTHTISFNPRTFPRKNLEFLYFLLSQKVRFCFSTLKKLVCICQAAFPMDFSLCTPRARVQEEHRHHTSNMHSNLQCWEEQQHEVVDPTKLRQPNMDRSRLVFQTGKVSSLWWFPTLNLSSDQRVSVDLEDGALTLVKLTFSTMKL